MIRCVVLDDEPLAVSLLSSYIKKTSDLLLTASGTKPVNVECHLQAGNCDLVFMDIQMPEKTGIELMRLFNAQNCFIITSAYPDYALESYNYNVVDYLLKPISYNRFLKSIEKYKTWKNNPANGKYIYIRESNAQHKVNLDVILYIEGFRDYIKIYTPGRSYMILLGLKDILKQLQGRRFIRIHRSFIVNTDKIRTVYSNEVHIDNVSIPIGETYKKEFLSALSE